MDLISASFTAVVAIAAVAIAVGIMRTSARRQIAEVSTRLKEELAAAQTLGREIQRQLAAAQDDLSARTEALGTTRAENAALKQDNKWLAGEIERERKALDTAQSLLEKALNTARHQDVKALELRAAKDLAVLWNDQGRREDALTLLLPVYDWFTEGFDTQDLREAKALLDQMR